MGSGQRTSCAELNIICRLSLIVEVPFDLVTGMADWMLILQLLALLGVANGTPIFAKKLLQDRLSTPLDGGLTLPDGEPLFGASKTIRGVILSVVATAGSAVLLHLDWGTGATIGGLSMLGDLFSSFVKRRLHLPLHAQAFGLDQIPEALLPLLIVKEQFNLTSNDIAVLVIAFIVLELVLSRILFRLKIRDRPF
jgi:CDP-2,3-bis-(O-geranylgeranyl)-sn-glycerol synthase